MYNVCDKAYINKEDNMATILLKRGQSSDIGELTLAEGEAAIAYNDDKSTAQLYVGGADGKPILVTADVSAAAQDALERANRYADAQITEKIDALINGAPQTLDTLKEIADEISENEGVVETLNAAIGGKVDKVSGKGLSEADFTNEEKTKLANIAANANNYTHPSTHAATMITQDSTHRFVSDAEKSTWDAKLGANSTVDGGAF